MNKEFFEKLQFRIATTSIGPSTARGMGPKGTIKSTQFFLSKLSLEDFKTADKVTFQRQLDRATKKLVLSLPKNGKHWGSARKFINIFLRGVVYDRFLCEKFGFQKIEPWLELPLDSHVAKGLRAENGGNKLPKWTTVIGLKQKDSKKHQRFAEAIASQRGIHRVHLDLFYWRAKERE